MTSESATIDLSDGAPVADADAPEGEAAPHRKSASAEPDRDRSRPKPTPPVARPAKFLADLTRAMRAAALAERDELLAGHQAEATAYLEQLQTESTERAASIRRAADDDIVAIRDWSKAELARIREETDRRIASRRSELEGELEDETARATRVAATLEERVEAYRAAMERFFERLLTIDDPATFAALAGNLPEPPAFDAAGRASEAPAPEPSLEPDPPTDAELPTDSQPVVAAVEPATASEAAPEPEAAAETQPAAETGPEAAAETQPAAETGPEAAGESADADPRMAALSLMPDFAAAESEANLGLDPLAFLGPTTPPSAGEGERAVVAPTGEIVTTKLVVTGLVSVAGIAAFKRQIARRAGVQSVTVSSGPDGEFVFTVVHHDDVELAAAIATLEGFSAAVTGSLDGAISVTARDPEAAA